MVAQHLLIKHCLLCSCMTGSHSPQVLRALVMHQQHLCLVLGLPRGQLLFQNCTRQRTYHSVRPCSLAVTQRADDSGTSPLSISRGLATHQVQDMVVVDACMNMTMQAVKGPLNGLDAPGNCLDAAWSTHHSSLLCVHP